MRKFLLLAILVVVGFVLNNTWGLIPPLGKILNPFDGLWAQPTSLLGKKDQKIILPGLKHPVEVWWDVEGIPHVKAQEVSDLYYVQGYLLAAERLFQMDLQTRVAAGRLAELAGSRVLGRDRFFVQLGMRRAARLTWEEMQKDPITQSAIESYTQGVNAFIEGLDSKSLPVEYKLLNIWPERWDHLRTVYLLKTMTFSLAGKSHDPILTHYLAEHGKAKVLDLFPEVPANVSPVVHQPSSLQRPIATTPVEKEFVSRFKAFPDFFMAPDEFNGSNQWAVSGKKSTTGFSLLANDTHLSYSLPNIWYEMQLTTPELNVYGATFPGAPGIIIGFTSSLAWAFTNATIDVMDWYEVEFQDESQSFYRFDGEWRSTLKESEVIKVKDGPSEKINLVWTHHGVTTQTEGNYGLVLRWIGHGGHNSWRPFFDLNQGQSFTDCQKAIARYSAPAQNTICADRNNIGIWHNGLTPRKWKDQGRFIMAGDKSGNDWSSYLTPQEIPHEINPESGFLRSANQHPLRKPTNYFGWYYDDSYRAQRISDVLAQKKLLSPEDLIQLQADGYDGFAASALPYLLKYLKDNDLSTEQQNSLKELKEWDFLTDPEKVAPTLFYAWWTEFEQLLWKDQLKVAKGKPLYPQRSRTVELLKDPLAERNKIWIDDIETKETETIQSLVSKAFVVAHETLSQQLGSNPELWQWQFKNKTELKHIAKFPGFGSGPLRINGSQYAVNANRGRHGAVWRMVVAFTQNEVEAWVNFPGGPSGHPMDPDYERFVDSWAKGKMRKALFLTHPQKEQIRAKVEFLPEAGG